MGFISALMDRISRAVQIQVQPWFRDHCFDGRPVLPAVESLLILAQEVRCCQYLGLNIQVMRDARFLRFLEVPAGTETLEVIVELEEIRDNAVRVGLFSRQQTGRFARSLEHASVVFGNDANWVWKDVDMELLAGQQPFTISGSRLYAELVPFGPAYRNVTAVDLFSSGAAALLQTPQFAAQPGQKELGSPFLLDSALHAACAWGQRFAGFVPFPVGFNTRRVVVPAQPNRQYRAQVVVVVSQGGELEFDIDLMDEAGELVEQLRGVRMRDVSSGRITVPDWVRRNRM